MKLPRTAAGYREEVLKYSNRSYTETIFQGFIYRFLQELLKHDETQIAAEFSDLDAHTLGHLITFHADDPCETYQFSYTQLQNLVDAPLPSKRSGQVLFLGGHIPGSWVAAVGAKYGISPEYFRRHIHLWRSSRGAVLYAVPTLPSVSSSAGITLRINTYGRSTRSFGNRSLASRRQMLPEVFFQNPTILTPAPGSTYIRGHAYLGDQEFLIEQDISVTVQSDGEGWSAVLWSDVGSRDLSQSQDFHWFLDHLKECSKSGLRWILLLPNAILGVDAELHHPLPSTAEGPVDPNNNRAGSLVQSASHLPREYPLLLDHSIAALDPLYALSPIFRFAATTSNQVLSNITRRYELISSTLWNPNFSKEYMYQLILQKHLLDDHASRHEEVLRYLRSPHLQRWAMQLTPEQATVADKAKQAVIADYEYLLAKFKTNAEHHHVAINVLTSTTALNESKKQIDLATQVTKLTVLATVFLPLSFVTGLFGMNFVELEGLSIYVWAVVTVAIGLVTLVVYGWDEVRTWFGTIRGRRRRVGIEEVNMGV